MRLLLAVCLVLALAPTATLAQPAAGVQTFAEALSVASDAPRFPTDDPGVARTPLPDDWSAHPRHDGAVWYRVRFDAPAAADPQALLALYVERACSNLLVQLNGRLIHEAEPRSPRGCHEPRLVTLPGALLMAQGNTLDLRVQGHELHRVAAVQRAGGLSALRIGPRAELAPAAASRAFWHVDMVQALTLALAIVGGLLLAVALLGRRQPTLGYGGALALTLALLNVRGWWPYAVPDAAALEFIACLLFPVALACVVQFLLSHANMRSRILEAGLIAQCVLLPASLLIAGPTRLFDTACAWYLLLVAEAIGASALYLRIAHGSARRDARLVMLAMLLAAGLLIGEMVVQQRLIDDPALPLMLVGLPSLVLLVGLAQLLVFARTVQAAEINRATLEQRVREVTVEIERNFAQLAEMRVEQVTEKERKRIAADLHDDLGAKLLTIVHTSESERISTLAREALEEMRLSVRGLTGKPVQLADALADWRAETVSRLGQAGIEIDWRSLTEDTEQVLPARGYVQTTRILREAVSNIIKHSGASHVKVRCAVNGGQFGLNIQDNGKGIPMELDGKLDRGHGMSSMKHRAKTMQGQCLVESGPGYGTVIRLTLPLGPEASAAAARG